MTERCSKKQFTIPVIKNSANLYLSNTAANAAVKELTYCDEKISFEQGIHILVKFTYSNTATAPLLKINQETAKIIYEGKPASGSNAWQAGSIIDFEYRGAEWYGTLCYQTESSEVTDRNDRIPTSQALLSTIRQGDAQITVGYITCSVDNTGAAQTAAKENFSLSENARLVIKMSAAYTYAATPTLSVNSSTPKAIYYNGTAASSSNTWQANELIDCIYDGTQWQCTKFSTEGYEVITNKVSSFQTTPDDEHYPTEKLVKESLDEKLNATGSFPGITAGLADNLYTTDGEEQEGQQFGFRATADATNGDTVSISDGDAELKTLSGQTLKQQINGDFSNTYNGWVLNGGSIDVANGIATYSKVTASALTHPFKSINGHKFYCSCDIKKSVATNDIRLYTCVSTGGVDVNASLTVISTNTTNWQKLSGIYSDTGIININHIGIRSLTANFSFEVKNAMCIDLTEMGLDATLTTATLCDTYFGDYVPQGVTNVSATNLKSVGFNAFNPVNVLDGYKIQGKLYAWVNGNSTVYTYSAEPSSGDAIYNSSREALEITVVSYSNNILSTTNAGSYTRTSTSDINDSEIVAEAGKKLIWCKILKSVTGAGTVNNGYVLYENLETYANQMVNVGFLPYEPNATNLPGATVEGVETISANSYNYNSNTIAGWLVATVTDTEHLCIHLKWTENRDSEYQSYSAYQLPIYQPTKGYTGGLVEQTGASTFVKYGDEVDLVNKKYHNRIATIDLGTLSGWILSIVGYYGWSNTVGDVTTKLYTKASAPTVGAAVYSDTDNATVMSYTVASVTETTITVNEIVYTRTDTTNDVSIPFVYTTTLTDAKFATTAYKAGLMSSYFTTEIYNNAVFQNKRNSIGTSAFNNRLAIRASWVTAEMTSEQIIAAINALSEDERTLYYIKTTEEVIDLPASTPTTYEVCDYGTEEWLGTSVMPTSTTHYYMRNLKDELRNHLDDHDTTWEKLSRKKDDLSLADTDYPSGKLLKLLHQSGATAPTTSTVGVVGSQYVVTTSGSEALYVCTATATVEDVTTYTWVQV